MNHIEPNTIVVLEIPEAYDGYEDHYTDLLGIEQGMTLLCLGEISNMKGHYAVVTRNGRIVFGLHPDLFRLPTDDEL